MWIRGILAEHYGVPVASVRYRTGGLNAAGRHEKFAYDDLARTAALRVSLPFAHEEYQRAVAMMGADYWAYGIEANRAVLSAFLRYATEQHLISEVPDVESLFAPETGAEFVI